MFVFNSQKDQKSKNLKHPNDYYNIGFGTLNLDQKQIHHKPFTPYHQYTNSPHCSLYISEGADKESLFNNQDHL